MWVNIPDGLGLTLSNNATTSGDGLGVSNVAIMAAGVPIANPGVAG